MRRFMIMLLAVLPCMLVGCGNSAVSISGNVSIDSKPLPLGRIALRPVSNNKEVRTVQAVITDGGYTFVKNQGLMPGEYSVVITGRRKTGKTLPPEEGSNEVVERYEQYLPAKYNTRTELTAQITSDTNSLDFELQLPKGKRR